MTPALPRGRPLTLCAWALVMWRKSGPLRGRRNGQSGKNKRGLNPRHGLCHNCRGWSWRWWRLPAPCSVPGGVPRRSLVVERFRSPRQSRTRGPRPGPWFRPNGDLMPLPFPLTPQLFCLLCWGPSPGGLPPPPLSIFSVLPFLLQAPSPGGVFPTSFASRLSRQSRRCCGR